MDWERVAGLTAATLGRAVLATACLTLPARGEEPQKDPPSIPLVLLGEKSDPQRGWLVDSDPARDQASFLSRSGEWRVISVEQQARAVVIGKSLVEQMPSAALATGLEHEDAFSRDHCELLLEQQGEVAIPALGTALTSKDLDARKRALGVLAKTPAPKLRSRIRSCLSCKDPFVRREALRAYAALQPDDLFEQCVHVLGWDSSPWVQHEAIHQLGALGTLRSVDPLIAHLARTSDRGLHMFTFGWLRRLTNRDLGREAEPWTNWWHNHREELLGEENL